MAKYVIPVLLVACLLLGYLWHVSAKTSAMLRAERDSLRSEVEDIRTERDSANRVANLRRDSIAEMADVRDSIARVNRILRSELIRAEREADSLIRPDFTYEGTDSALAARADSILRDRIRAAGDSL